MSKEPMTEERIAEIRAREKAATQGAWREECVIGRRKEIETFHTIRDKDGAIVDVLPISAYHDAAFIAHAREDIPALLDEVERLRAENARQKEVISFLGDAAKSLARDEADRRKYDQQAALSLKNGEN